MTRMTILRYVFCMLINGIIASRVVYTRGAKLSRIVAIKIANCMRSACKLISENCIHVRLSEVLQCNHSCRSFLSMQVGFIETTKTEVMKFVFCTKAKSMFVEYVLPIRITLLLEKSESHDHGDLQIKP